MSNTMVRYLTMILLVCSIFLWSNTEAEEQQQSPYDQLMQTLENLRPQESPMEVLIATEKERYEFGETLDIRFQANQDCYLILMNISLTKDPASMGMEYLPGDIFFLVPSHNVSDNRIKGGQRYSTLADFDMYIEGEPPAGTEIVNLFCSPEKIDLFDADLNENKPFYIVKPDDEKKLKELIMRLEQLKNQKWSGNSVAIRLGWGTVAKGGKTRGNWKKGFIPPISTTGTTGKEILFPPIGTTGTTGHTESLDNP